MVHTKCSLSLTLILLVALDISHQWLSEEFLADYRLGGMDERGARILLRNQDGISSPVCSDLWSDYEANELCQAEGYEGGRHTTTTTDQNFSETEVTCFEWDNYGGDVMAAYEDCSRKNYSDTDTFPCLRSEAAAVFCWNSPWIPLTTVIQQVSTNSKKWKVWFNLGSIKYGQFYDAFQDSLMSPYPEASDFWANHCGKDMDVRMKVKEGVVTLSGKFNRKKKCKDKSECLRLEFRGEKILEGECVNMDDRNTKLRRK